MKFLVHVPKTERLTIYTVVGCKKACGTFLSNEASRKFRIIV